MSETQLVLTAEPDRVAVIYDDDGSIYDWALSWQAGQVYANAGFEVIALNDDQLPGGVRTVAEQQELYDYERRIAADCFGPGARHNF